MTLTLVLPRALLSAAALLLWAFAAFGAYCAIVALGRALVPLLPFEPRAERTARWVSVGILLVLAFACGALGFGAWYAR